MTELPGVILGGLVPLLVQGAVVLLGFSILRMVGK